MRTRTLSRPSDVGAAIGLRCGHRSHHLKPVPANGAKQLQRMSRDTCKTRAIRTRCLASLVVLASSNFRRFSIRTDAPAGINFAARRIQLRRQQTLPHLGFGTGRPGGSREPEVTLEDGRRRLVTAVRIAMQTGYRLVDTTLFSGMEKAVLEGIHESGVKRSEVTIATKLLQMAHNSAESVQASLENSLSNLDCSCIDLYLLQSPRGGKIKEVWSKLIELRDQGLIRALGVSNFGAGQLEGMRLSGLELPQVNQVEIHCWRQLPDLAEYHRKNGIATMCMAPLARGEMFGKTDVAAIAEELGVTEAAVAARWCMQMGYIPIPRSVQPLHIRENLASGFELTTSHMERIQKVDTNYIACRKASPCCELPWDAISDSIPDKSLWDDSKKRKAEAAERRGNLQDERARKARERRERQMRAQGDAPAAQVSYGRGHQEIDLCNLDQFRCIFWIFLVSSHCISDNSEHVLPHGVLSFYQAEVAAQRRWH